MQFVNLDLDFLDSDDKVHFWEKLGQKSQSCPFFLKIGTPGISKMLIIIPTLVFWLSNPKSIYGQSWDKKFKFVHFDWKMAHMVYRDADFYSEIS